MFKAYTFREAIIPIHHIHMYVDMLIYFVYYICEELVKQVIRIKELKTGSHDLYVL